MILHADADAFFAAVELRDRPELGDRPFAVAAQVICCPNYPARGFGVHGGMTIGSARRACPELELVPMRPAAYQQAGADLFDLFGRHATAVEPGSMEEAFLSVPGTHEDAVRVAETVRRQAREQIGLPVSIGVAGTKLIAKLASRRAKPDGLVAVAPDREAALTPLLRVDRLWGIGPATAATLTTAGITTLADLPDPDRLVTLVGKTLARRLIAYAAGRDERPVSAPGPRTSIDRSKTISPASRQGSRVREVLAGLAATVARDLAASGRDHGGLAVTVRYDDGAEMVERGRVGEDGLQASASRLLDATGFAEDGRGVRLVGVGLRLRRPRADPAQPVLPFG